MMTSNYIPSTNIRNTPCHYMSYELGLELKILPHKIFSQNFW